MDFRARLVEKAESRKKTFLAVGCASIGESDQSHKVTCERIIFACNKAAALLDKTGLSKAGKEQAAQIERKLLVIARQGGPLACIRFWGHNGPIAPFCAMPEQKASETKRV